MLFKIYGVWMIYMYDLVIWNKWFRMEGCGEGGVGILLMVSF